MTPGDASAIAFSRREIAGCGDLHCAERFPGWTTLVPCEHNAAALVDYLRSPRPVFLTRLAHDTRSLAA
jgi:hypothetical protein